MKRTNVIAVSAIYIECEGVKKHYVCITPVSRYGVLGSFLTICYFGAMLANDSIYFIAGALCSICVQFIRTYSARSIFLNAARTIYNHARKYG